MNSVVVSCIHLYSTAFGCLESEAVKGRHHKILAGSFNQTTALYSSNVVCNDGYLIEGTKVNMVSLICKHRARDDVYTWEGNPSYQCVGKTNV